MSGSPTSGNAASASTASAASQAANIRAAILRSAQNVTQPVPGGAQNYPSPMAGSPLIVPIATRPVGLIKRFMVRVGITFTTPAGTTLNRTAFGGSNILSRLTLTDLNNLTRINAPGWALHLLATAKRRRPFAGALVGTTGIASSVGYGNNLGAMVDNTPAQIVGAGQSTTLYFIYEIPVMYTETDFRGAIYAGTNQASLAINATINNVGFAAPFGADPTLAVFQMAAAGQTAPTITNVSVDPYQNYFDQLPNGSNGVPVLPLSDMSTIYNFQDATMTGMIAGTDFPIPFQNLRSFLSTFVVLDNGGTLYPGTDVNTFKLASANLYTYWQKAPWLVAEGARNEIGTDFPPGVYYFPSRNKPITTSQAGSIELYVNMLQVNANAAALVAFEFFGTALTLGAASLSSN